MLQLNVLKEKLFLTEEKLLYANERISELQGNLITSRDRIAILEKAVEQRPTVSEIIKKEDNATSFCTGIDSYEKLWMMFNWLSQFVPKEDTMIMIMMMMNIYKPNNIPLPSSTLPVMGEQWP